MFHLGKQWSRMDNKEFWSYGIKTFDYNFRTHTPKLSNQSIVFIRHEVLIGCFFFEYKYKDSHVVIFILWKI